NKANLATVNISILDDETLDAAIIDSPAYERRSTSAWQAKVNAAPSASYIYRGIIWEWLKSCYDAEYAIFLLRVCGLLTAPYTGDPYDLMAEAAETEFPGEPLPERLTAPIQPDYANPDLVAALAPARTAGGAA
ncbi:MAG TPA: hypothetical protein VKA94_16395, partial [Hyphomicrobiales bacterium]|nr:hypothetical protein [Hyphomicrobiales bacterium]